MAEPASVAASIERSSSVQFEQYVRESRQRLFRFAVVLCGDPVLAADLVTDVLGRAFERWGQVSAARDLHAYVRRMVVNEFVSWQRRRARSVPHPDIGQLADVRALMSGPDPADAHADRSALVDELARLPARQRAAIVLRYYEDLGDAQIATALDCRIGTVRSLISRGLATLRVTDTFSRGRSYDVPHDVPRDISKDISHDRTMS
ncbi:MAG TPA: SigE family RNA polymerase sigma factor [Jatrophihabitantaceae bacterium]|jgi:RNA polymerase sigma-70 factor (sigma-E family)